MQTRLKPIMDSRIRPDYPQTNFIKDGIQTIEINRGCLRQCPFCHADPNYKTFPIPEIKTRKVQIWGEGFLYDHDIKGKIIELGSKRVNNKVVYYGLSQGIDYRLLTEELVQLLSTYRFGKINNKGNWYKGMRIAWDWGKEQESEIKETIDLLTKYKYQKKFISVFVIVNWKISHALCIYKLNKLKDWGVCIDDCYFDTTKKEMLPLYWSRKEMKDFRKKARSHNIQIKMERT